jgi:hypothetical protein
MEQQWTRQSPTVDGFYWECSDANQCPPCLVLVRAGVSQLVGDPEDREAIDSAYYCESWWMGPLALTVPQRP